MLLISSSADGHLGCLHCLAIMNSHATSVYVDIVFIFLRSTSRNEIASPNIFNLQKLEKMSNHVKFGIINPPEGHPKK